MLRITLVDGEKAIINGAVIRAIGRTRICVENKVPILRGRDVMPPEEATTPARKLYLACMLAYIDGEGRAAHQDEMIDLLRALLAAYPVESCKTACMRVASDLARGNYYKALTPVRDIIAIEASLAAEAMAA